MALAKLIIGLAIALGVGLVVYGALMPTGITGVATINQSLNINQTNPDPTFASARTLNNLLPLFVVLAISLTILGAVMRSGVM